MSKTAEERAEQLCRLWANDHGTFLPNELFQRIRVALRAHATAALEAAMAALCPGCRHSVETWEQKDWLPDGSFRQFRGWIHKYGNGTMSPCEAAAIRALREEG